MLVTPGGLIPRCTTRDWSRCSSQVWAVRVSGSGVPVPNPQNAQAAETRPGCSGTYRSPGNTPPHPSFRSRQHLLFWLGGPCGSEFPSIGSQQNAGQCVTLSKLARAPCGRRHSGKRAHRIAFLRQTLTSSVRFCSDWRVRWLSLPHPGRIESHWASPVWRPWLT